MKILGLHDGHGASIAALVDGSIIKSFEEERFSRLKGDSGFPKLAIDFLKEEMPAFFSQLDYVAVPSFQVEYNLLATKCWLREPCRQTTVSYPLPGSPCSSGSRDYC